ncbi:WxPxxD family membrane protein [Alkalicoccobacillus gibsonii]|uniref:WxPxxD family membrane protein n=1 Tax=Alkalicoccobacillus gibsonii TaxID=79881 RepID=UPI003F7B5E33
MNKSNPIIFVLVFILISIAWFTQNNSYISKYYDEGHDNLESLIELFYYMNSSASGFSSIQNYSLTFLIPFLLILQQFYKEQTVSKVVRLKNRSKVYLTEVKYILKATIVLSMMHTIINLTGSFLFFNAELVLDSGLVEYSVLNTIGIAFFYFFVGLIYCIVQHFIRSQSISMVITLLLIGGLFYVSKIVIPNHWTPLKELTILMRLLEGETEVLEVGWIYLKQIIFIIIFYLLGSISSGRKEFISES